MKLNSLRILVLLLFCLSHLDRVVAQDAIFSQFYSSPLYLNPAFAGSGHDYRLVMNYRNQPFPNFGTFSTINLGIDAHAPGLFGGLGLLVTSDHQGELLMKNQLSAIYAFHLQAGENFFINFGAQTGYYRQDLRWDRLEFAESGEVPPGQTWTHASNFAAGILLYSDRLYGGIAAHNLNRPRESFFDNYGLPMKFTAHIGAYLGPGQSRGMAAAAPDYFISPNIIFQNQADAFRINYGLYAGLQSLIAGVWFRQELTDPATLIFLLGINTGNYRIGYSYDYSLSGFTSVKHGAHEISLSILFDSEARKLRRRILNCPAF